MIAWSSSQWYVALVALLALIGSATVAVNVAHGIYPPWAAWPGWALSLLTTGGVGVLAHETRRTRQYDTKIHRLGGDA